MFGVDITGMSCSGYRRVLRAIYSMVHSNMQPLTFSSYPHSDKLTNFPYFLLEEVMLLLTIDIVTRLNLV